MPAGLLLMLLQMAGVERNPGPSPPCPICNKTITGKHFSIWCHRGGYVHAYCAKFPRKGKWNRDYVCDKCHWCLKTSPPPIPAKKKIDPEIKIMQWNANGLSGKLPDLIRYMREKDISICAVQETKLNQKSKVPHFDGFSLLRCDREKNSGGGLAFIVKEGTPVREINLTKDSVLERQMLTLTGKHEDITLVNYYIPPTSSCPSGFSPDFRQILCSGPALILGDANCHHDHWHSSGEEDTRGRNLAEIIDVSDFTILNEDTPTRQPVSGGESSPDVSLASADIAMITHWEVDIALSSDHLPIIVSIQLHSEIQYSEKRTYINFSKADWEGFSSFIEEHIPTDTTNDVTKAEKQFRKTLLQGMKKFIPCGRIPKIRPGYPSEAAKLAAKRDELRRNDPRNADIPKMSEEVQNLTSSYRRKKWQEHVKTCDLKDGLSKHWKTVKAISGSKTPKISSISFRGRHFHKNLSCANEFNKLFNPGTKMLAPKSRRTLLRNIHRERKEDTELFLKSEVERAIKDTNMRS